MTTHDPKICGAANRQGKPCRRWAGWGTHHPGVGRCKLHGGASPQAERTGMLTLARREAQVMGMPLEIDPVEAILQCIAIAAGEVRYCSERIAVLQTDEAARPLVTTIARPKREKGGGESTGMTREAHIGPPGLNIWIVARHEAMDRLVAYSKVAHATGVSERQIALAERMGEQLSMLWERTMNAIDGLTEAQRLQAAKAYAREIALLERPVIDGVARDVA